MKIPSSININTLKAYESHPISIPREPRATESFNLESWDEDLPKSLQEICVQAIAKNWKENPILDEIVLLVDKYLLLDLLGTDLPLSLTVPKINGDIYWYRCYMERWPLLLPNNVKPLEVFEIVRTNNIRKLSNNHTTSENRGTNDIVAENLSENCNLKNIDVTKAKFGASEKQGEKAGEENMLRTWKALFIEMHMKEYLENLKPEEYNAEEMKELSDICSPYIKVLKIEQMQCSENSDARLSLNPILTGFQNMCELTLCFKQKYTGENFSWRVLRTSPHDIALLTKGLEKLRLKILRIQNSDIDCGKLLTILKSLLKHEIRTLEFSHCRIADKGAMGIAKFSLEIPVNQIILTNNRIGTKGAKSLAYASSKENCQITEMDLHLNRITDNGGNFLFEASRVGAKKLKSLFLSGCGFSEKLSIEGLLQSNDNCLEVLDISCNNIGEDLGQKILNAVQHNCNIKKLDLKMCKISSETELAIYELVRSNRKKRKVAQSAETEKKRKTKKEMQLFDEEFQREFENIFQ